MKKSFLVILILALAAAILVGLWRYKQGQKKAPINSPSGQTQEQDQKKIAPINMDLSNVPDAEIPAGFPKDFPFEGKVSVLNNYVGQTQTATQYSRQFYSLKTPAENFKLFKKYFTDKKWTILLEFEAEPMSISAKDTAGNFYDISIATDAGTKKTIVSAAMTKSK